MVAALLLLRVGLLRATGAVETREPEPEGQQLWKALRQVLATQPEGHRVVLDRKQHVRHPTAFRQISIKSPVLSLTEYMNWAYIITSESHTMLASPFLLLLL